MSLPEARDSLKDREANERSMVRTCSCVLWVLGPGAVKVGCDKDQQIMTLKMLWDILISKEICLKMFED